MKVLAAIVLVIMFVFVPPLIEPIGCYEYRLRNWVEGVKKAVIILILFATCLWAVTEMFSY